jgi:RNA polymerase sigma factor FliA
VEALEEQLWTDYHNGVTAAREQLVSQYLPLAKRLAAGLFARRPSNDVEFGDYLHLAYVGLLEAIQRYRTDSGAQFATFATYRIRGAILNGVPLMTETGDRISYLTRAHRDRADSVLEGQPEAAAASLASLIDMVVAVALTVQLDEVAEQESAEPTAAADPYSSRLYEDTQRRLKRAVESLPERERQIVHFHYFHQMGFDEIAGLLAVTKGRVSQLHKRALDQVRDALGKARFAEFY